MKTQLKVAVAQLRWDQSIDSNAEKIKHYIAEAATQGCDVILFPEASLTGYDFTYATTLTPDNITEAMADVGSQCADSHIYAIVGSLQRRSGEDRLLNIAHVIDPNGDVVYEYAKLHLASIEEKKLCRPGDKIALFDVDGITCTIMICRDGRSLDLALLSTLAGAKICFQLSNNSDTLEASWWKKFAGRSSQPISPKSTVYHINANGVGQNLSGTLHTLGESYIVDPTGLPIAEAGKYEEALLVATLDMKRSTGNHAKASLDGPSYLRDNWSSSISAVISHKDDKVV
jgi:predicted amidohydrolase